MAVSGKFQADFESFYSAVQKAEVSLRSFEQGAGKVETSLNKMADSLSGRKLVQDAALMAEAVERIGGTSKLTQAELQRVAAKASEAVDKLKALGIDVPPGIAKIAAESRAAGTALDTMKSVALNVASAFGIAFSVGAVKSWVADVVNAGSHIQDLSKKLGVSTDAVQRWEYAVSLSGGSIDTVDKAVAFMNRTLSEGDAGTIAILKKLGLSFETIRAMRPEDAFNTITDAIAKVPDPMLKAEAATKLFSRSGQELLPAIAEGFVQTAHSASVMSDATIQALDEAGDAWTRLGHTATIWSAKLIVAAEDSLNVYGRMKADLDQLGLSAAALATAPSIPKLFTPEGAAQIKVSSSELERANAVLDEQRRKLDQVAERQAALADKLFGRDLIARAGEYATALGSVDNIARLTKDSQAELNRVMAAAYDALVKAGLGASDAANQYRMLRDMTTDFAAINAKLAAMPDPFAAQTKARHDAFRQTLVDQLDLNQGLTDSQLYWAHAGEIADAAMKKAAAAVQSTTATVDTATAAVGRLAQGFFSIGPSNVDSLNADAEKNLRRGGIASTVGLLQRQAATRIANGLPQFDKGGPVTKDGPIYAHAGEYVVPKGGSGGGTMVMIGAGAIVIQGGSAQAGRDAADALLARLKSKGVRV